MSENESKDHAVIRVLYVILFYVIYGLTDVVFALIAIVQTVLNLFGGGPSMTLKLFGASLGLYVKQIADYLSYASEEKPFPFSDWPEAQVEDSQ